MVRAEKLTPLFNLPIELREQIYRDVLASPNQGPQLLQTCREINTEAHKYLFHRAVTFNSQQSLFDWLDKSPQRYRPHVTEISLHIQDVNLRSLLEQGALDRQASSSPQLRNWGLYKQELQRLRDALAELPKIRAINVRALSGRQSHLYRDFLSEILELLSSMYPTLLDFSLEGNMHYQRLGFLSTLSQLQSFSFDGFSSSSSTETASIFARLQKLTSLSVVSQHRMLTPRSHEHSTFTAKSQVFTGDVIRSINQLASFSVVEHPPTAGSPLFFTSEVLASLHAHQTLKTLSISLSHRPDSETLKALQDYLEKSGIERLELDWPDLDVEVLDAYPLLDSNIRVFWVRARSKRDAVNIMEFIYNARERGSAQSLRKMVLVRSHSVHGGVSVGRAEGRSSEVQAAHAMTLGESSLANDEDEIAVNIAKTRLTKLGVQVAWCTEDA